MFFFSQVFFFGLMMVTQTLTHTCENIALPCFYRSVGQPDSSTKYYLLWLIRCQCVTSAGHYNSNSKCLNFYNKYKYYTINTCGCSYKQSHHVPWRGTEITELKNMGLRYLENCCSLVYSLLRSKSNFFILNATVTMTTNVLLSVSHLKWQLCPEKTRWLCVLEKSSRPENLEQQHRLVVTCANSPLICRGWLGSGLAGTDHLVLQKMDTFPISCFIRALDICLDEQKNNNARFSMLQHHCVSCPWLDCERIIRGSSKLGSFKMFDQTLKFQKEIVMVHVTNNSYHC